jgi:hypothetical protein
MKDFLERLEDAAEKEFFEMTDGCKEGYFKCSCGRVASLDDAHPVSNSPFAMPVCDVCFDDFVRRNSS